MLLLHTTDLTFQEFPVGKPRYAILSHTWGSEEVTYQDMLGDRSLITEKAGYKKIKDCCALARKEGFVWVWIDTCCINKSSSSELSEAINSMFAWYKEAEVCYAYLVDVAPPPFGYFLESDNMKKISSEFHLRLQGQWKLFLSSRWFTRGWTLQELIAPRHVSFHASDWSFLGTKDELADMLEEHTKISKGALTGDPVENFPVRVRMQWAAGRITTRPEDMAYCLLGIFDINMPLLYGEGARAFQRLQEEILSVTEDYSLLAWSSFDFPGDCTFQAGHTSAFAASPNDFADMRFNSADNKAPGVRSPELSIYHYATEVPEVHRVLLIPSQRLLEENIFMDTEHEVLLRQRREGRVFDPPVMSSRGISLTMLTNEVPGEKQGDREQEWLAWTFLNFHMDEERYGICISLQEDEKPLGSGIKAARKWPIWLYLVPEAMLETFTPKTMYLRAIGSTIMSQPWAQFETKVSGERISLNINKEGVSAELYQILPHRERNGSDIKRRADQNIWDIFGQGSKPTTPISVDYVWILEFHLLKAKNETRGRQLFKFAILLGQHRRLSQAGSWLCGVRPIPQSGSGEATMKESAGTYNMGYLKDVSFGQTGLCQFPWGMVGAVIRKTGQHYIVEVLARIDN